MALGTKHLQAQVGATATTLYTAPTVTLSKTQLVLSNIDTVQRTVDVTITDTSAVTTRHVIKAAPIPVGGSLVIKGLLLNSTDVLKALCDSANQVEATLSIVELT